MRFPCLVLDHDDTVVNSTATVHFPSFLEFLKLKGLPDDYTLEDYFRKNFHPGVIELFRSAGIDGELMAEEERFWNEYVQQHVPKAYDGIRELLWEQKNAGVKLCVISHSYKQNILRDYRENGLPEPDLVFGWECPREQRKPSPHCVFEIMKHYGFKPEELLVIDDLKPGHDMARAAGVNFAAAGWANDIPEIESFMRFSSDIYFKTAAELRAYLEG